MKILNYGSLNIDCIYKVQHIAKPGETIAAKEYSRSAGGKGLNQSIALARAGACVYHAGKRGADGAFLTQLLEENKVDIRFVSDKGSFTGNALIQVDDVGQNCIIVYGGANHEQSSDEIYNTLRFFEKGDYLILQNEINRLDEIVDAAYSLGMKIIFNPSPINASLSQNILNKVSWLILNELEGKALTGSSEPADIMQGLRRLYPNADVVLTLGENGAACSRGGAQYQCAAHKAIVADTTAAGDTFTGYFFAMLSKGENVQTALDTASTASAITVSRPGAAVSIPFLSELNEALI